MKDQSILIETLSCQPLVLLKTNTTQNDFQIVREASHPYWQLKNYIAKDVATMALAGRHARVPLAAYCIDPL